MKNKLKKFLSRMYKLCKKYGDCPEKERLEANKFKKLKIKLKNRVED